MPDGDASSSGEENIENSASGISEHEITDSAQYTEFDDDFIAESALDLVQQQSGSASDR